MKYRHYLFDFDGTLVDSMPAYAESMKRILDENGVSYGEDLIAAITPLGTMGAAKYFQGLGLDLSLEEIFELMKRYLCEAYFYYIPAKDKVKETLLKLKEQGAVLRVLTASPHITLDPCLKRLGLYDLFEDVWSCDDFGLEKSDPAIYLAAAERMGLPCSEILFADDNLGACTTAVSAGLRVCGVYDVTSEGDREQMRRTCHYYAEDLSALLSL